MAGFSDFNDFLSKVTVDGNVLEAPFHKISTAPEAAGVYHSLWRVGRYPAAGADPAGTPGEAYSSTDGGLAKWANLSPQTKHLVSLEGGASVDCMLMLYDRLVGVGGITLNSTGNKTVSSATLPRYTDGKGVQAWLEVTTATTTTAPIVSMNSYTDQDGNTGASGATITFPAAATNVDALIGPLPVASGDYGVRAVSTINVATAASAGVASLVLLRPLAYLPLVANVGNALDFMAMIPSLPRIYDGATPALAIQAGSTTIVSLWGMLRAAYG